MPKKYCHECCDKRYYLGRTELGTFSDYDGNPPPTTAVYACSVDDCRVPWSWEPCRHVKNRRLVRTCTVTEEFDD